MIGRRHGLVEIQVAPDSSKLISADLQAGTFYVALRNKIMSVFGTEILITDGLAKDSLLVNELVPDSLFKHQTTADTTVMHYLVEDSSTVDLLTAGSRDGDTLMVDSQVLDSLISDSLIVELQDKDVQAKEPPAKEPAAKKLPITEPEAADLVIVDSVAQDPSVADSVAEDLTVAVSLAGASLVTDFLYGSGCISLQGRTSVVLDPQRASVANTIAAACSKPPAGADTIAYYVDVDSLPPLSVTELALSMKGDSIELVSDPQLVANLSDLLVKMNKSVWPRWYDPTWVKVVGAVGLVAAVVIPVCAVTGCLDGGGTSTGNVVVSLPN